MTLREAFIIARVHWLLQWPLLLATAIFYAFLLREAYAFGSAGSVRIGAVICASTILAVGMWLLRVGERATRQVYDAWVEQGCGTLLIGD